MKAEAEPIGRRGWSIVINFVIWFWLFCALPLQRRFSGLLG